MSAETIDKRVANKLKTVIENEQQLMANAIKGNVSGAAVAITDTSPVEHEMRVKVRKKNLLPYPYNAYKDNAGGMYTDNGDGTITVNGVFSGTPTCELCKFTLPNGTYTIGGGVDSSHKVSVRLYDVKTGANIAHSLASTITTFTVNEPTEVKCWIYAAANQTYDNLVIYPQLEEGTTATSYTPYIEDVSTVKVLECGKNLFDKNGLTTVPITSNGGCVVEQVENGFKCTQKHRFQYPDNSHIFKVIAGEDYTLSAKADNLTYVPRVLVLWFDKDKNAITSPQMTFTSANAKTAEIFTAPANAEFASITINGGIEISNLEYTVTFTDIQFELGNQATEYEAYRGTEHAVDADGAVNGIMGKGAPITLYTDTAGAVIDCKYNRDINKAFAELFNALISLGANV